MAEAIRSGGALGPISNSARPLLPSGPPSLSVGLDTPSVVPAPLAPTVSQPSAFQPVVPSRVPTRSPPVKVGSTASGANSLLRRGPGTPTRSDEDSSPAPSSSGSDDRIRSPSEGGKADLEDDEEDTEDRERDEDGDVDEDETGDGIQLKEANRRVPLGGQNAFAWPAHLADDERRCVVKNGRFNSSFRPSLWPVPLPYTSSVPNS